MPWPVGGPRRLARVGWLGSKLVSLTRESARASAWCGKGGARVGGWRASRPNRAAREAAPDGLDDTPSGTLRPRRERYPRARAAARASRAERVRAGSCAAASGEGGQVRKAGAGSLAISVCGEASRSRDGRSARKLESRPALGGRRASATPNACVSESGCVLQPPALAARRPQLKQHSRPRELAASLCSGSSPPHRPPPCASPAARPPLRPRPRPPSSSPVSPFAPCAGWWRRSRAAAARRRRAAWQRAAARAVVTADGGAAPLRRHCACGRRVTSRAATRGASCRSCRHASSHGRLARASTGQASRRP